MIKELIIQDNVFINETVNVDFDGPVYILKNEFINSHLIVNGHKFW